MAANGTASTAEVLKDIHDGMVNDVTWCLTPDESKRAAWLGGGLLIFCYIETLGRLFFADQYKHSSQYSEAFIRVFMEDFGKAIDTEYRKLRSLQGSSADVFWKFCDDFRNGLVHQYFPKGKGLLEIDYEVVEPNVYLRQHPEEGNERILISLRNLEIVFRAGADRLLEVVEKGETVEYAGKSIDVRRNCQTRLEKWLEEALGNGT